MPRYRGPRRLNIEQARLPRTPPQLGHVDDDFMLLQKKSVF